ncbi:MULTISPECIES: DUF6888 family protein [Nostocales]
MQPTLEQLQECYRICSALTNMYLHASVSKDRQAF